MPPQEYYTFDPSGEVTITGCDPRKPTQVADFSVSGDVLSLRETVFYPTCSTTAVTISNPSWTDYRAVFEGDGTFAFELFTPLPCGSSGQRTSYLMLAL
jgi:hypothetical protein